MTDQLIEPKLLSPDSADAVLLNTEAVLELVASEAEACDSEGRLTPALVRAFREAGLFQMAGIPAIICGPGSIEQAHKPDEFVAVSELERCEGFLRRLADYCTRPV